MSFRVMRGLLLLYLAFWVFLGPSTEDMEHISATLLCITNLKQMSIMAQMDKQKICQTCLLTISWQ